MKPLPPPHVPGNTPWERFNNILKTVVKVPKETILREEAKEKRKKAQKRQKKKPSALKGFEFKCQQN